MAVVDGSVDTAARDGARTDNLYYDNYLQPPGEAFAGLHQITSRSSTCRPSGPKSAFIVPIRRSRCVFRWCGARVGSCSGVQLSRDVFIGAAGVVLAASHWEVHALPSRRFALVGRAGIAVVAKADAAGGTTRVIGCDDRAAAGVGTACASSDDDALPGDKRQRSVSCKPCHASSVVGLRQTHRLTPPARILILAQ